MQSQLILKRNDITFFLFLDSLSQLPVDATFKFYKVGKASPSLEFNTIMRFSKNVHLSELKKLLINQHIKGIDLIKKFPTYDVTIHVKKKDKLYTAHTQFQWVEISQLLGEGYSLLGNKSTV